MSEARTYLKRALAIREQALPDHPDTAATLMNLGILAQGQGEMVEARSYLERALTVDEQRLGTDHPTTRTIRERLAALSACPQ